LAIGVDGTAKDMFNNIFHARKPLHKPLRKLPQNQIVKPILFYLIFAMRKEIIG